MTVAIISVCIVTILVGLVILVGDKRTIRKQRKQYQPAPQDELTAYLMEAYYDNSK